LFKLSLYASVNIFDMNEEIIRKRIFIGTFILLLLFIYFLKRETREVDESLTANLIDEAVYDAPHILEMAAKSGQLGYCNFLIFKQTIMPIQIMTRNFSFVAFFSV
jgi:hypothetical protein